MTIPCLIHAAAIAHSNLYAAIDSNSALTYEQLNRMTCAWTAHLKRQGIVAGVRVAVIEFNRIELAPAFWALMRLGATAVLTDPRLPAASLASSLERVNCSQRLTFDNSPAYVNLPLSAITPPPSDTQPENDDIAPQLDLDRPATIMFTSGSSDTPKAVLHSFGNHYFNALGSNENITVEPGGRWMQSLPAHHVGGLAILFRCALSCATVVIADPGDDLSEAAVRQEVTHMSLVPTQLQRLVGKKDALPHLRSQLKAILLGGAPAPENLIARARDAGLPVYTSYGLTEMASQVATGPPSAPTQPRLLAHRELMISSEGEILVRGATLFGGYVTSKTIERPFDASGWFHTGDTGRLDDNQTLAVLGRRDNMFISGGENIYPEQIERALGQLDGVERAIVVPVDDAEFGRRPVAFVRYDYGWMKDDADESPIAEETIRRHLEIRLPRFMLPVSIYPWPESYRPAGLKDDRAFFRRLVVRLRKR